jgi:hypothetical protein
MDDKKARKAIIFIMKRIREKVKRTVKYLRISYKQANGNERLLMGMCTLVMLVYAWWVLLVL